MAFTNAQQTNSIAYTSTGAETLTTQLVKSFPNDAYPKKLSVTVGADKSCTYTVEFSIDGTTWDNPQTLSTTGTAKTSGLYDNVHKWFRITCGTSATHSIRVAW